MGSSGFWQELKRRRACRVVAACVVVGWLLIQVATQVFPIFHWPNRIDQTVVLAILVGFLIALVLAWAFDAMPASIGRTGGGKRRQRGAAAVAPSHCRRGTHG